MTTNLLPTDERPVLVLPAKPAVQVCAARPALRLTLPGKPNFERDQQRARRLEARGWLTEAIAEERAGYCGQKLRQRARLALKGGGL